MLSRSMLNKTILPKLFARVSIRYLKWKKTSSKKRERRIKMTLCNKLLLYVSNMQITKDLPCNLKNLNLSS